MTVTFYLIKLIDIRKNINEHRILYKIVILISNSVAHSYYLQDQNADKQTTKSNTEKTQRFYSQRRPQRRTWITLGSCLPIAENGKGEFFYSYGERPEFYSRSFENILQDHTNTFTWNENTYNQHCLACVDNIVYFMLCIVVEIFPCQLQLLCLLIIKIGMMHQFVIPDLLNGKYVQTFG